MANVVGTAASEIIDASFTTPVTDGSDTISGLAGDDKIFGLGGDDFIKGGEGADALDGGFGVDTAEYTDSTAAVIVSLTTGLGVGGFAAGDTLTGIENLTGSAFDDQLIGDFANNVLKGDAGADQLVGGGGIDTLDGGAGNDILWGGSGADVIDGGAGADTLYYGNGGGAAADLPDTTGVTIALNLSGGGVGHGGFAEGDTFTGIENVVGSHFSDKIAGNAFANVLTGLGGNDTFVVINPGVTVIELAGQGADTVKSSVTCTLSPNVETLVLTGALATNGTGNAGANTINGNFGNNVLAGLAGADILKGLIGSDTLVGGLGRDVMTGGANQDLFRFDTVSDTGNNALNRDVITDFSHGADLIDLNAIDANGAALGNGNFTFIGTAAFTGAKGQLRAFFDGANRTVVAADIDSNKVADFQIELTGHKVLAAGDFIL